MFYAIPLENRPTWRNPPWMTVLLILVNMLVFWGPQRSEQQAEDKAVHYYVRSVLPAIELPAYLDWLDTTHARHASQARQAYEHQQYAALVADLQQAPPFLARLRAGQVVTPANPRYGEWQAARQTFDAMLPPPFTARWAQDYDSGAPWRPITWLTSTFLHGSTGHLLGNMLFLFLFGCSVELALAAAFGRVTYLAFYLLGGFGASALAAWAYAGQGGLGLGASGAVSALMGMYAVMYRMRRIRFFYQLLFYFNYVTAPALLLLPAWIANELLQHLLGGRGIAYMAHLGGLLTGALLMAGAMRLRRVQAPVTAAETPEAQEARQFQAMAATARQLGSAMQFDRASSAWAAAAKLRPTDAATLRAWFNIAKLRPEGDDFHRCARLIFALPGHDDDTLRLQHDSYQSYLDLARPAVRLRPDDMARLVGRFTRIREHHDAERLCQVLLRTAPDHPRLADTLCVCVNGLLQAGLVERARAWLPQLQKWAPQERVTVLLAGV
ncbi:MAG TPA: rhomboid family intramembrane serine protease [Burkholderiaceae bacterium]